MRNARALVVVSIGALAAIVWAVQAVQVTVNGKSVRAKMVEGALYLRASDVAAAMDMQIAKSGGGYAIAPAGGANQLQGTNGKLGQEIYTGKWKFTVTDVQHTQAYTLKFSASKIDFKADPGTELVIVTCRIKNAIPKSVDMYIVDTPDTALTDTQEHTYKAKWTDTFGGVADTLLPGAAKEFAIVYQVPEGTVLKDFIFGIEPVSRSQYGHTTLRISLK